MKKIERFFPNNKSITISDDELKTLLNEEEKKYIHLLEAHKHKYNELKKSNIKKRIQEDQ